MRRSRHVDSRKRNAVGNRHAVPSELSRRRASAGATAPPTDGDGAAIAVAPVFELAEREREGALEGVVDDWESRDEPADVIDELTDEPRRH